jgi:tetratricopeptide (TPR) repeat protein
MGHIIKKLGILVMTFVCLQGTAQNNLLSNEAAKLCQNKQLDAAKSKIATALASDEKTEAYTWYVAGFIYKECYKEFESKKRNSEYRVQAVEYFLKALDIDKKHEHSSNIKTGVKYLASTYYNDALLSTREFDEATASEPEKYFNMFRKLMRTAEPGCNLNTYDKEFHQQVAQRYFDLWQINIDNNELPEKSLKHYNEALRVDSTDCMLYYNVGVLHYNRAVFMYRSIGPDTDMFDLIDIQMRASDIIKSKAMLVMIKADKLCPNSAEILRALLYMNKALERDKDVVYFKSEIERLIAEGKMKNLTPPKK